jgi:hypothetical protein
MHRTAHNVMGTRGAWGRREHPSTNGQPATTESGRDMYLQTGDGPAQNKGVDVMGALVRVHGLQVHHVPDDCTWEEAQHKHGALSAAASKDSNTRAHSSGGCLTHCGTRR